MASFDEKVSICLENINEFADLMKKVHDLSKCILDHCEIGMFSDDLRSYVNSRRRSSRLVKKNFLCLCEKYSQGFEDCFMVVKNEDSMIYFFSKVNKRNGNSSDN